MILYAILENEPRCVLAVPSKLYKGRRFIFSTCDVVLSCFWKTAGFFHDMPQQRWGSDLSWRRKVPILSNLAHVPCILLAKKNW